MARCRPRSQAHDALSTPEKSQIGASGADPDEPKVHTRDVQAALLAALSGPYGLPVPLVAEKACVSERTVYRVKDGEYDRLMDLGMADQILLAVDGELAHCTLEWPDGRRERGI